MLLLFFVFHSTSGVNGLVSKRQCDKEGHRSEQIKSFIFHRDSSTSTSSLDITETESPLSRLHIDGDGGSMTEF